MNGNSLNGVVAHEKPCIIFEAARKIKENRLVKKNSGDGRKVRP
jgi:hypothetical protein